MINRCKSNPCCGDQTYCTQLTPLNQGPSHFPNYGELETEADRHATLVRRVAHLEQRVRDLQEMLRKPEIFPAEWGLREQDVRLLSVFARQGRASHAALAEAAEHKLNGRDRVRATNAAIIRLRARVQPLGITILSSYGDGYYLPPVSLARVRSAIGFAPSVEK